MSRLALRWTWASEACTCSLCPHLRPSQVPSDEWRREALLRLLKRPLGTLLPPPRQCTRARARQRRLLTRLCASSHHSSRTRSRKRSSSQPSILPQKRYASLLREVPPLRPSLCRAPLLQAAQWLRINPPIPCPLTGRGLDFDMDYRNLTLKTQSVSQ